MLRILNHRLLRITEQSVGGEQFVFGRERGTRDPLGLISMIMGKVQI